MTGNLSAVTGIPNFILDELLPKLKDTELRLILLITRHTLGWRNSKTGERKERDWLSHNQLRQKTGRSSAAISRSIDGLFRRGLIEVEDQLGHRLESRQIRRRHRGRLYFHLVPSVIAGDFPVDTLKRRLHKAKTTKESSDKSAVVFEKETVHPLATETTKRSHRIQSDWQRVGEILKRSRKWKRS